MIKVDADIQFPDRYPTIERKTPTVDQEGYVKVNGEKLRPQIDYIPQEGFQEILSTCDADVIFTGGSASAGKCQSIFSKVVTPFGFRFMGELKVGDTISGADGGMQKVLAVYEKGLKDMYKFTFADGATCEATLEHLWNVRKMRGLSKKARLNGLGVDDDWRVWTTEGIIKHLNGSGKTKLAIPLSKPVKFTRPTKLPIDPYVLGCLIGDGCLTGSSRPTITTKDEFIVSEFNRLGYETKLINDGRNLSYTIQSDALIEGLKMLGLYGKKSCDKFIPERYKLSTIENRFALIQGIMDTDGYAEKGKTGVGFSSASERLSKDVQEVIWSLGGMATLFTKKAGYKDKSGEYKQCLDAHVLYIQTECNKKLFRIDRKINAIKDRRFTKCRQIVSVEKTGRCLCRCIAVTNPDSLYLTEKSCIVTHNTWAILTEAMRGLGRKGYSAILLKKELVEAKAGGGMLADAKQIYTEIDGCMYTSSDSPTFDFPQWKSTIQLTHLNLQGSGQERDAQEKAKNKQASYIAIDELTNFTFKVWKYWFSRNRDGSGMRPKMICTLNANGWHWSRRMLDWYIGDDNFVIPERVGVKRYFSVEGETVEDVVWGDSVDDVVEKAGIEITKEMIAKGIKKETLVKSFTFIPGNLMDNAILTHSTGGGNVANLYNLGKSERMKLMYGYWGEMEEGEGMVTRSQIKQLFSNPHDGDDTRRLSIDIGDGGDASRAWVWKGNQVINIETTYTSDAPEKIKWIKMLKDKYNVEIGNIAVDATGGGNYIDDYLRGVVGLVMNKSAIAEYDDAGNAVVFEQYASIRDQLMGKLAAMIVSQSVSIGIDPDTTLKHGRGGAKESSLIDIISDQATSLLKRLQRANGKYYFISKDEYKKSRGESPDDLDCFHMGMYFFLATKTRKETAKPLTPNDFAALYNW